MASESLPTVELITVGLKSRDPRWWKHQTDEFLDNWAESIVPRHMLDDYEGKQVIQERMRDARSRLLKDEKGVTDKDIAWIEKWYIAEDDKELDW